MKRFIPLILLYTVSAHSALPDPNDPYFKPAPPNGVELTWTPLPAAQEALPGFQYVIWCGPDPTTQIPCGKGMFNDDPLKRKNFWMPDEIITMGFQATDIFCARVAGAVTTGSGPRSDSICTTSNMDWSNILTAPKPESIIRK